MQAGFDTYVTVGDADTYIKSRYLTSSTDRKRWIELDYADKEVFLANACIEIEQLPFRGRKAVVNQPLSFPRLPYQYGHTDSGAPTTVKYAQIELALWLSDEDKQSEYTKRRDLQAQGVESFGIGDLSESYVVGAAVKPAPLLCSKSASLLAQYLNGGYSTC